MPHLSPAVIKIKHQRGESREKNVLQGKQKLDEAGFPFGFEVLFVGFEGPNFISCLHILWIDVTSVLDPDP